MCSDFEEESLKSDHSLKATKLLSWDTFFTTLYNVATTFKSVYEVLKCDHSNESTKQHFSLVLFVRLYTMALT